MKRLIFTLPVIAIQTTFASELHTFTSKYGKTVEAKIISVNSAKTKVELERKNGKKVWVSRNIFSIDDQTYINRWIENSKKVDSELSPEDSVTFNSAEQKKPLTKKEVKKIVKQYEEAWSRENYDLYQRLCMDPCSKVRFDNILMKSFSIIGYDENTVEVKFRIKYNYEDCWHENLKGRTIEHEGWVQLTPDGKIKYEPDVLGTEHPMIDAMGYMNRLNPYTYTGRNTTVENYKRGTNSVLKKI